MYFNKPCFLVGFFDAHTNSRRRRPTRGSPSFCPPIPEGATAIPWDTTTATHSGGQLFAPLHGSCKQIFASFFCLPTRGIFRFSTWKNEPMAYGCASQMFVNVSSGKTFRMICIAPLISALIFSPSPAWKSPRVFLLDLL